MHTLPNKKAWRIVAYSCYRFTRAFLMNKQYNFHAFLIYNLARWELGAKLKHFYFMKAFLIIVGVIFVIYLMLKRGMFRPKILKMYEPLIKELNNYAFNGQGTYTFLKDGKLEVYKQDSPQILYFELDKGCPGVTDAFKDDLIIEWKRKYFQQEIVFSERVSKNAYLQYSDIKNRYC